MEEAQIDKSQVQVLNINTDPVGLFTIPKGKHIKYKKELHTIEKEAPELKL